jgi:predicted dienelactone hydrolase
MNVATDELLERIKRLEAQMRLLSAHAGIPLEGDVPDAVLSLARRDERVKAAMKLTEMTGMDFGEAQRVVNRL